MADQTDQLAERVMEFSEVILDRIIEGFKVLRDKDRADGYATDMGALGGVSMLVDAVKKHGPTDAGILLALAVRRLADGRAVSQ